MSAEREVYFWRYAHGLQHRMLHDAMDALRAFLEGYVYRQPHEGLPDFAQCAPGGKRTLSGEDVLRRVR